MLMSLLCRGLCRCLIFEIPHDTSMPDASIANFKITRTLNIHFQSSTHGYSTFQSTVLIYSCVPYPLVAVLSFVPFIPSHSTSANSHIRKSHFASVCRLCVARSVSFFAESHLLASVCSFHLHKFRRQFRPTMRGMRKRIVGGKSGSESENESGRLLFLVG